ncbi:MAG: FtsK/SpoIIIE domain-containing protein, partial [Bowdeniella nasicola]|nr:FtsK/SpoIIIE domain-containing protein [Bowdeniella nasicola]
MCPWAVPLPTRRTPIRFLLGQGWRAPIPTASAAFTDAARAISQQEETDQLSTSVAFQDVVDINETIHRWRQATSLTVPLGKDAHGEEITVDLVADGPHALIAGTTGAGKSELLTTWLISMAAYTSPDQLNFLLVDFKGGAAFGPLIDLPHSVALLTDLQPAATARALSSLRAQIRHREEIIAQVGARNIDEYERLRGPGTPAIARLVIVIDEFAALASDHPKILDQILRIATQGRSLGIHLIAATQRPAGSVTPAMSANMPLRICLRVTTPADSSDILDNSQAASLPPIPGRAIIRRDTTEVFQTAWCGTVEDVRALVHRINMAWQQSGGNHIAPPWAPELPDRIEDLPTAAAWGIADDPAHLRHTLWQPSGRNLLIVGGAGSGKSSAAILAAQQLTRLRDNHRTRAVRDETKPAYLLHQSGGTRGGVQNGGTHTGQQACATGSGSQTCATGSGSLNEISQGGLQRGKSECEPERPVYFIGAEDHARMIPGLAGWIPPDAVHLSRMLVDELTVKAGAVVIDEVNRWRLTIDDALGAGSGTDLLERLIRASSACVLTGDPNSLTARWASLFSERLLLGGVDDSAQALAGMPADIRGEIVPAGRGRENSDWQLVQLRVPGAGSATGARPW